MAFNVNCGKNTKANGRSGDPAPPNWSLLPAWPLSPQSTHNRAQRTGHASGRVLQRLLAQKEKPRAPVLAATTSPASRPRAP